MDYIAGLSEKVSGSDMTVEVDESYFGRRTYNRSRLLTTAWGFGGAEHESCRAYLIPVADTLLTIIKIWIKPGTAIISDCWAGYFRLSEEGYTHHTFNRSVAFVDPCTGTHTSTVQATWKHVKVLLNPCKRLTNYTRYLAEYVSGGLCSASWVDSFTRFTAARIVD